MWAGVRKNDRIKHTSTWRSMTTPVQEISSLLELQDICRKHRDTVFIVKMYATWCRPCREIHEEFVKIMNEPQYSGICDVYQMDIDCDEDIIETLQVYKLPCFIVFRDSGEVTRLQGTKDTTELRKLLDTTVKNTSVM